MADRTKIHHVSFPSVYEWATSPINSIQESVRWLAIRTLKAGPIPNHVAFIMDGNRRFARKRRVAKLEGHSAGFNKLKQTLEWCLNLGVTAVTVYAFSIENFKRSPEEVNGLMQLALVKFKTLLEDSEVVHRNQVSVRILGDVSLLPEELQQVLGKVVTMTAHYTKAVLNICFAYTAQEEMTMATRTLAQGVEQGRLQPSDITANLMEYALYTLDTPEVDLLIRSSGEVRLSDFMLWQCGSACLEYTSVLWPEFGYWDMMKCVFKYQQCYKSIKAMRAREASRRVKHEHALLQQQVSQQLHRRREEEEEIDMEALTQRLASKRDARWRQFREDVYRERFQAFERLSIAYDRRIRGDKDI
eukprot:TRINITY_DN9613_c0_g4_i2.p1 TRINITY_DN9613_c0_g4~~TRINITY_DN9613_c0_g4_i2.p1  ORF type:complete len:359 (+),score=53.71 TRINITY_DN9613_c0_g4_i2:184-1260(+)